MDPLKTERLILRRRSVDDAAVVRRLWTERDPRVRAHRRLDAVHRPTVEEIAAAIGAQGEVPGLLTVERKEQADVIGYCGLVFHGNRSRDEPELAFELLRACQGHGYATEAGRAVVAWAGETGQAEPGARGVSLLTVREASGDERASSRHS